MFQPSIPRSALGTPHRIALRVENRLHGYIVVHQQLSRLQLGYTPVTQLHRCQSTTYPPCHSFLNCYRRRPRLAV